MSYWFILYALDYVGYVSALDVHRQQILGVKVVKLIFDAKQFFVDGFPSNIRLNAVVEEPEMTIRSMYQSIPFYPSPSARRLRLLSKKPFVR
jgi:hypothetical protein